MSSLVGVYLLSHVWLFAALWTAACQAPLSSAISWSLLKFMSIESVMLLNHLILCHPVLLLSSFFPSIRGFFNESSLHIRWPKYCSFSRSPSNEYSGLISFRIDWFDLFAVQGTFKSLLQWVSSSHKTAKVLELHVQHQASNEYSGLISFRIDWFELLAVQGTLKKLLMWCKISVFNSQLTNSPKLISPQRAQLTYLLIGKPSFQPSV